MKPFVTLALIAASITAPLSSAVAGVLNLGTVEKTSYTGPLPPLDYAGRRWSHPNGCDYSLAGRPGERVWYVVLNTMGGNDCVRYFVEVAIPNDHSVTKNLYRYN